MTVPQSHIDDAVGTQSDGYPKLFQILMANGSSLYFRDGPETTWNSILWESNGVQLTGIAKSVSEDINRPKLIIRNPAGVYSTLVDQGFLNKGTVRRFTVKREHLEAGTVAFQRHQWRIARVLEVNHVSIMLELRSGLDGQHFVIPGGVFVPPDFPMVSLS